MLFYFLVKILGNLKMYSKYKYKISHKKLSLKRKLNFRGRLKKSFSICNSRLNKKKIDFFSGSFENNYINNWAGVGIFNNFTLISSYIVISCMRKALNFLFFCLKTRQKIFLVSNDFKIRKYLEKIKFSFLFKRRLMVYSNSWVAGFFSNVYRRKRRKFIPDLIISLTPDFDGMIVRESFIILRPTIGLTGGKYGLNTVDFPILVDGLFLSYAFLLIKIVLDFYFLTLKKKVKF